MDDRVKVADELERRFADERHSLANLATFTKAMLPTILAALRSTGTGRSEAEAMRERCAKEAEYVAQMGRMALSGGMEGAHFNRAKVSVATDLASRIRGIDPAGRTALNPPAREGEGAQP